MSSVVVAIVDGVRELLDAQSEADGFVRRFTPERAYSVKLELEDGDLTVHVVHGDVEVTAEFRGKVKYLVPVTIAVRKKFSASELDVNSGFGAKDEVDSLAELTEQICEFMAKKTLANGAQSIGPATILALAPSNEFEENQQFLGIVRVTFLHLVSM